MSSLQYHNLVTPPALPSQRGLDCGKIQSSCHCTMAPFSSIPLLKTYRILREMTCIWRSGNGQILFGAIRNIWAEPNCVRVVHMVLAYTLSTSGSILPSLPMLLSRSFQHEDKTWEMYAFHSENMPLMATPMACFAT